MPLTHHKRLRAAFSKYAGKSHTRDGSAYGACVVECAGKKACGIVSTNHRALVTNTSLSHTRYNRCQKTCSPFCGLECLSRDLNFTSEVE